MKRSTVLWALVMLNAALLVALMWRLGGENTAVAQVPMRGEYVLVPATVANMPNGAVYVVNTREGVLSGFVLDTQRGDLVPMAPIPLARVMAAPGR